MENITVLRLAAALLLVGLSLNLSATDATVTNGQTLARARMVQTIDSASVASISLAAAATNITYLWEIWNLGTNAITITNGIVGTNVVLDASMMTGLRALETNQWRVIYGAGR